MAAMAEPVIFDKDGRTYKVFGLTERAGSISKASAEMDTIITERVKSAKAALKHWEGPHAGTFVEQANAVLAKMASLKLALWGASARLSSFPAPLNPSVGTVRYYDGVYAGARVAPVRPTGPGRAGAEPDKLRQYVTVASGQDGRFASLAGTVTLDGVTATVTSRRAPDAPEETQPVRPAELITLPDVASLVRPLVADSASVSEFTTGVATAFEKADQRLLDLLATYPALAVYIVPGLAPGRVSGESSLAIALAYFDKFDTAAHGGEPDGNISTSDLEAIRNDLSLPEYVRDAAGHLLDSPTLLHMAAGGGEFLTRDGITTFVEMNRTVRTIDQHFVRFDIAAKGGEPDGFVSLADLKAAANDQSLGADVRQAAQWLIDHPEQLAMLGTYSQIKELGGTPVPIPYASRGFKRQDLIGRIIDGQVYGDDPEAAERFVNSLPVADDGRPGLPIWLSSTDGFKALANAALTGAGGDLTDSHSVIAHLPETNDAVRNELITAYYKMMAGRVDRIMAGDKAGDPTLPGHPGANWFTYGQWASDGVHEVINGNLSGLISTDDSQNAADGNQWIFNDVGGRFAAFVELHERTGNNPSAAQLEAFFRDNFGDGDHELRTGFAAYLAAMRESDPVRRQALTFQANMLLTAHEQAGVQPYVEGIGKPLVPDDIEVAWVDLTIGEYRLDLDKDIPNVAGANNQVADKSKMRTLDLDVGGKRPTDFSQPGLTFGPAGGPEAPGVIRLADISGLQGFSASSATWHREGAEVYELVLVPTAPDLVVPQRVLPDPDELRGSGATAWTDYNERMWTILKLYQQTHTDRPVFLGPKGRSFGDHGWLEPGARPGG